MSAKVEGILRSCKSLLAIFRVLQAEPRRRGRKEWQRLSKELEALGLLTGLDRNLLAAYCQAHALWTEAVASIGRYGTMVKSPNGFPMQSPYGAVANKQVDIMVRIAAEFGMTLSRTPMGDKSPGDPFEASLQDRG